MIFTEMNIKKILPLILFFFTLSLAIPKTSKAIDLQETLTSENSIVTKIQEGIEYFFAFKVENKIQVLEKHADKRLDMANEYAQKGANDRVMDLLKDYEQIKEKQNNLMNNMGDGEVLGLVKERVIEQQRTIEEIKTKIDEGTKQEVIEVQEQVVNQVAKHVIDVNGSEGTTEFLNEVIHVWAPGTGPGGGNAGVVIEGGEMKFATGASMDSPEADVKTVEIKTGGGPESVVENSNQGNQVEEKADPGTNDTKVWIDP